MLNIHRHYIDLIFEEEPVDNIFSDDDSSSSDSENASN